MGFKPKYAYKIKSPGVIGKYTVLSQEKPSGPITVNAGEMLLLMYDSTEIARYGTAIRIKVGCTVSRKPVCDSWVYHFYNRVLTSGVRVGETVSYNTSISCSLGQYNGIAGTYITDNNKIYSSDGYVCVILGATANTADGKMTTDQTFTFSGFDLTFDTQITYPFVISSNLTGGYKSPSKAFSVEVTSTNYSDAVTQYSVANGVFYFKASSDSSYKSISFEGNTVTVPAGALASNITYDAYLTARSTNGQTATSSHITISTVDGTAVVAPLSPNNEVTHGGITFTWNFSNTTGELQYAYDLQISTDNSTWETIFSHVVSSQPSATYTQTRAGDTFWRARGYNQNDVAGEWSASAHYVNNVPPQPPVILEVIAGGRIQVRWSAENQISYHIQVVGGKSDQIVYDSGDVYGTESLALVNTYLPNETYTIKVKISNIYGNESEWSTIQFQQSTELTPLDYSAEYDAARNCVVITVSSKGFDKYYLIRNDELIARFTENTYIDMYASGETTYRLIAVTSEDLFAQAIFTIKANVPSARLIAMDGTVFTVSERWNSLNNVEQSEEIRYTANEYLGATAPEHIFSKMRLKRFTRAFYDPNRTASQLLGTVAFYADEHGNGDWVAITSISRSDSWIGDDTNLEMQVTARNEAITYDI